MGVWLRGVHWGSERVLVGELDMAGGRKYFWKAN